MEMAVHDDEGVGQVKESEAEEELGIEALLEKQTVMVIPEVPDAATTTTGGSGRHRMRGKRVQQYWEHPDESDTFTFPNGESEGTQELCYNRCRILEMFYQISLFHQRQVEGRKMRRVSRRCWLKPG